MFEALRAWFTALADVTSPTPPSAPGVPSQAFTNGASANATPSLPGSLIAGPFGTSVLLPGPVGHSTWSSVVTTLSNANPYRDVLAQAILLKLLEDYSGDAAGAAIRLAAPQLATHAYDMAEALIAEGVKRNQ